MDSPPIGTPLKCLVCALDKPWGTFSTATGEAVCVDCRDARHRLAAAEERLREVDGALGRLQAAARGVEGALRSRYAPEEWPKCRVCGSDLTIGQFGPGGLVLHCDSEAARWLRPGLRRGMPEYNAAYKHYGDSEFRSYKRDDEDVIALLDAVLADPPAASHPVSAAPCSECLHAGHSEPCMAFVPVPGGQNLCRCAATPSTDEEGRR